MIKLVNGSGGEVYRLCSSCLKQCKENCRLQEDTKPKDCLLLKHYLDMARSELPAGYQVFVKYMELKCIFYLAKKGVVVEEHNHPKALIGEILIRKNNPEWFDEEGFLLEREF
jgi:hypothetical protein